MNRILDYLIKTSTLNRLLILFFAFVLFSIIFYFLLYSPKRERIKNLKVELQALNTEYTNNKILADNLPKYKKEYEELQLKFKEASEKLPTDKEIPSLLKNISDLGGLSQVEFTLFKPGLEMPEKYHASVPVDMELSGHFHDFITFLDKLSKLPRIVKISDISIKAVQEEETRLEAKCLANTFKLMPEAQTSPAPQTGPAK